MPKFEPKNPNRLLHRNYAPISDYLKAKDFRDNRLWTIVNGKLVTMVNNEYLSEAEFNQRYPVPISLNFLRNPENSDKTKAYLI